MSNREYQLKDKSGTDALILHQSDSIPQAGRGEVQIKFHACALNYRDIDISKGEHLFPVNANVVPTSDGAGEITAVGEGVTRFKVGDRVSPNFILNHLGGKLTQEDARLNLGANADGCLREYGVYPALSCVQIPSSLSYEEASTLPCAALTAWNSLFGLGNKQLQAGETVLVQGTGGVSLFGAQFALAANAKVILTSSSNEKIALAKKHLGEKNLLTINYREIPEWGKKAKEISDGGKGVDFVLDVGGATTLKQSFEALAFGGSICLIGYVARNEKEQSKSNDNDDLFKIALMKNAIVRGIHVGSKEQFNQMVQFIDAHQIKPIIGKTFKFEDAKDAYQYFQAPKHLGKVVIKI